jgi:hypothetical protein
VKLICLNSQITVSGSLHLLYITSGAFTDRYILTVNSKHGLSLQTYDDIYQWSIHSDTASQFWRDAYQFLEIAPIEAQSSIGMTIQPNVRMVPVFLFIGLNL